ncbi:MAG: O-antigen ligase family protein [Opitutaceae bacterium]
MKPQSDSPDNRVRVLEFIVLAHVGLLLVGASWAFGGAAGWARTLIVGWGSLSLPLVLFAVRRHAARGQSLSQALLWLCPFAAFALLVLLSSFNPSFSARTFGTQILLAHTGAAHPAWPSTVLPATTREHLWLFAAIYLSGFNLVLAIRRRAVLRTLLLIAVGNAVILSVFGTFQKLTSTGLYFGAIAAPNSRFFATFVYGNHWAAYVVLLLAACVGMLFYYVRRNADGETSRFPLMLGVVSLLLMAITPLLAGSRAGTLLVVGLIGIGLVQLTLRIRRRRRLLSGSTAWPLTGLALCVAGVAGGAIYLGRNAVQERWQDTEEQWRTGLLHERLSLYADTWHLARERPWFGWGLGSFATTLQLIRPRPIEPNRQYEHSYVDAHSDWLQSLAEVGFVGTILLILSVLGPLLSTRAWKFAGVLPAYLLGGCGLILLYAGVEFPFANPAVMIAFWICFFSAIQYVRLSDETRPGP